LAQRHQKKVGDDATFWPLWLAQDVEGITVYTLAYEAPASNWLGTSMPLQDRAVNVLEILLGAPDLKTGPIVFVCHSLGGLIVKQLLLDLQQQKDRRKDTKDLLNRVTEIVFAATPHTGSRHASLLDRLRFFAWPSTIARTLAANDPALRAINVAYRGLADERKNFLQHRVFYETQGTPLGVIVDELSSDPGLPGDPPVSIDATDISIAKPFHSMSVLYAKTRDFVVAGAPASEGENGALEIFELPPVRSEPPLNLLPKLIRVAGIGLVVLIGYKGVQALIAQPPAEHLIEQLHVKDIQIAALNKQAADLTKMLLEKIPAGGPLLSRRLGRRCSRSRKARRKATVVLRKRLAC
jgi:pimeloyl-ACP methyl ester carboxylesterase